MKREIKFRAWDKSREKMHYPDELTFSEYEQNWVVISMWKGKEKIRMYFLNLIPLQYTGLKDKNGKEIYEGDMVKYKNRKMEVVYGNHICAFYMVDKEGLEYFKTGAYPHDDENKDIKIIGNIYKHPELLKERVEK